MKTEEFYHSRVVEVGGLAYIVRQHQTASIQQEREQAAVLAVTLSKQGIDLSFAGVEVIPYVGGD